MREPYFVRSRGGGQAGRWDLVMPLPWLHVKAHEALKSEERKRRRAAEAREKEERDEGRGRAAGRDEEDTQAGGRGEDDERARQQLNGNDGGGPSQWGEETLRRKIE